MPCSEKVKHIIDEQEVEIECPKPATFRYDWEWGDGGECCGDHRGVLQSKAGQLQRSIVFSSLASGVYQPPKLTALPPEVGLLKTKLAEEMEHRNKLERQVQRLENERETAAGKMREQELRIQDLLKTNAAIKTEHDALLETMTTPKGDKSEGTTVIEGGPITSTGSKKRH